MVESKVFEDEEEEEDLEGFRRRREEGIERVG